MPETFPLTLFVVSLAVAIDLFAMSLLRSRARSRLRTPEDVRIFGQYSPILTSVKKSTRALRHSIRGVYTVGLELVREVFADETRRMKLSVALACTFSSIFIGLAFARSTDVNGWQLWTWLAGILFLTAALVPPVRISLNRTWILPGLLFFSALALRLPLLETVPGGLHVDEMGVAGFSLRHLYFLPGLTLNPFGFGPSSHPALYHYIIRLTLYLFGETISALRSSSAVAGSLGVVATYALITVLSDRRTALFTSVLMAGYHYHVHWSRIALNNIWDTLWVPLMLAAFAYGWKKGWSGGAVFSGLAFGFSQYFYPGSRIGFFLLVFLILWLWRQEPSQKRRLIYLGKFIITSVCVAAPLGLSAILNWEVFIGRARQTWGWSPEAIRVITGENINILRYLWHQVTRSLGAFTVFADETGFYGPGIPFVIGLAALLFLIGFIWAVFNRKWLPVLWILLTAFFGGFLLGGNPSSSHFVVAIPAICWLTALPLIWLYENGHPRWSIVLLLVVLITDLAFYFGVYVPGEPRDLIGAFPTDY